MSEKPKTSQQRLSELSKALDAHDRQKELPLTRPQPVVKSHFKTGPNTGMSKVALVFGLCFIWASNLGVITLQIAAMTGAIGLQGALPTWGEVVAQVLVGLLFSAAVVAFYKFKNRSPGAPLE